MIVGRPTPEEYPIYFKAYVDAVPQDDMFAALESSAHELVNLLNGLSEEQLNFRYAEGKWSVKEMVGHILDAERIFAYRALRFSRNDQTELSAFEEDDYVPQSNATHRTRESLVEEFKAVRLSSILFFRSCTEEMLLRSGKANGREVSVRALGWMMAGHLLHHLRVIRERYVK